MFQIKSILFGRVFAKLASLIGVFTILLVVSTGALAQNRFDLTSPDDFTYTQDFNSLPASGASSWSNGSTVAGWLVSMGNSVNLTASNGNHTEAGLYSYGATGSTDRALGTLNNNKTTNYSTILQFKNVSGVTIKHVKVTYRLEMWRKGSSSSTETLGFEYERGTSLGIGTKSNWIKVDELNALATTTSPAGPLNGNLEVVELTYIFYNINIQNFEEFRFRWTDPSNGDWGLALDDVSVETKVGGIVFYNKNMTDLAVLSNWGMNTDGSGTQPSSFINDNHTFVIRNYAAGSTHDMFANWTVDGINTKVVLGSGTSPVTFNMVSKVLTGRINVADNATLQINNNTPPTLNDLAPTSTVVFGSNAPATINSGTIFGNVVFNSKKKNKFLNKVQIKGKLDLIDGNLEIGDQDVILDATATIVNASPSRYIITSGKGKFKKTILPGAGASTFFPVGSATSYSPAQITMAASGQADVFSVGVLDGVYGSYNNDVPALNTALISKTVNKTWVISEDVKGGSDISLTFTWSATDILTGFDATKCHVKHYENNAWDADMPAVASTSTLLDGLTPVTTYSITRTGITSFSPFTVSSEAPAVLPVELLHFTVKATADNTVKLNWSTATEKNSYLFQVERSQDGKNFNAIGVVNAAGTTSSQSDYSFTDRNPLVGTAYYRLRQVELDGTAEYLPVRSVNLKGALNLSLNVYPNPAPGGQVNLQMQGLQAGEEVKVLITDIMGASLLQRKLTAGNNVVLTSGELKAGTYLVKVVDKAGVLTQKLIVN